MWYKSSIQIKVICWYNYDEICKWYRWGRLVFTNVKQINPTFIRNVIYKSGTLQIRKPLFINMKKNLKTILFMSTELTNGANTKNYGKKGLIINCVTLEELQHFHVTRLSCVVAFISF